MEVDFIELFMFKLDFDDQHVFHKKRHLFVVVVVLVFCFVLFFPITLRTL